MSFGSESGRTRSGSKGFSSKEKKLKKKRQDFHTHRRMHFQDVGPQNHEEVRARTILSLEKLGHQVLSTEPGGYDLAAWKKSLGSLLDDFQDKIGTDRVGAEFRARREEAALKLVPTSLEDIEREIQKLNQEEDQAREAIAQSERTAAARRASLREEREKCSSDLKEERQRLADIKEAKKYRPFFSRLINSGPSVEDAEERVEEAEAKLKALDEEVEKSRKARSVGESGSEEANSAYHDAQRKLEEAQARLLELRSATETRLQLAREREIVTQTIAAIISSMKLDDGASEEGRGQALQA